MDGVLYLAGSVAGHGWSPPWPGRIESINETGFLIEADGTERAVRWRANPEGAGP